MVTDGGNFLKGGLLRPHDPLNGGFPANAEARPILNPVFREIACNLSFRPRVGCRIPRA
jgi:hypothetical protein